MIIQELGLIGEVTLVRFVGETMWVTFRDGQSALIAVQKKSILIRGIDFHINLKTENWVAQVEREIALCSSNTVQLCTSSPSKFIVFLRFCIKTFLFRNFNISQTAGDYNSLGIPKVPPIRPKTPPARPQPPSRPPMPSATTPKHTPKAGVISIVKPDPTARPSSGGDASSAASSVPHRPAPPVVASQTYQELEQKSNLSRKSSSSTTPSPVHEASPKLSPTAQSLIIHDQDTGAIYEEISDDIVSSFIVLLN